MSSTDSTSSHDTFAAHSCLLRLELTGTCMQASRQAGRQAGRPRGVHPQGVTASTGTAVAAAARCTKPASPMIIMWHSS